MMNIKRIRLFAFIVSLITTLPCLSNDELLVEGFLAGTLVHTPQGCRRIEQIQEGDLVTVYNFKRERFVSRKVVKPFSWHASSHLVLLVNDEFIGTGFEHKFYVPEQDDWVAARNLKAGDYLFIQSGKLAKIDAILRVQKHVDLHTLIIEKKLNFLVGAQGILAHNFIVIPFIVAWGAGMGTQIMWTAMLESFLSSAALYVALRCLPKNKPCQACADFLENNCNQSVFNNLCRPFFLTDLYSPPLFSPTIEKYEDTSCNSCTMPEINQQSKTSITLFRDAIFKNFDVSQQESNGINIRDLEVNFGESFEPRRLCYPYYPQHAIQKFTGPAYTNIFSACSPPPSVIATTYPRFMEGSAASEVAKKNKEKQNKQQGTDPNNNGGNGPGSAEKLAVAEAARRADEQRKNACSAGKQQPASQKPITAQQEIVKDTQKTFNKSVHNIPDIYVSSHKAQSKFKHASVLKVQGNYNPDKGQEFIEAIQKHARSSETKIIHGTYRKDQVIHFFNPKTNVNVMTNPSGEFISVWELKEKQLKCMLESGSL